jgi:hypothetical protein
VRVRTVCNQDGSLLSKWGPTVYFKTAQVGADPCVPPSDVVVTAGTNDSNVSWTPVPNAHGYQFRYRAINSVTWTLQVLPGFASGTQLTGLTPGGKYAYQVRTKCNSNPAVWSNFTAVDTIVLQLRLGEWDNATVVETYPNPSTGTVTFNLHGNGMLQLVDAIGREIVHVTVTEPSGVITLDNLPNGMLAYCFTNANGVIQRGRVVVVR